LIDWGALEPAFVKRSASMRRTEAQVPSSFMINSLAAAREAAEEQAARQQQTGDCRAVKMKMSQKKSTQTPRTRKGMPDGSAWNDRRGPGGAKG